MANKHTQRTLLQDLIQSAVMTTGIILFFGGVILAAPFVGAFITWDFSDLNYHFILYFVDNYPGEFLRMVVGAWVAGVVAMLVVSRT